MSATVIRERAARRRARASRVRSRRRDHRAAVARGLWRALAVLPGAPVIDPAGRH